MVQVYRLGGAGRRNSRNGEPGDNDDRRADRGQKMKGEKKGEMRMKWKLIRHDPFEKEGRKKGGKAVGGAIYFFYISGQTKWGGVKQV